MERRGFRRWVTYLGLLCLALVVSAFGSYYFGGSLDNWAYDFIFSATRPKPWPKHSVILAIDERTLRTRGGAPNLRGMLIQAMPLVNAGQPKAVVIDVILSDRENPAVEAALARVLRPIHNLVLASDLQSDGFEKPLAEFIGPSTAIGHASVRLDDGDAIARAIPLEKHYDPAHQRLWALSLEAFRFYRGVQQIEEVYPSSLKVGDTTIPAYYREGGYSEGRLMRVRFARPEPGQEIPRVSMEDLIEHPALAAQFAGKVVFVGATAATEHDRLATPLTSGSVQPTSGIEINAEAFETMANRLFLVTAPEYLMLLLAAAFVAAAGLSFRYLPGWMAYAASVLILVAAAFTPYFFFQRGLVFAASMSLVPAALGSACAAGYYHLVVRRNLRRSEADRALYQQKFHFATHELRTPLATIQASSELMARFPSLSEDKRKQILQNINSESKRLAHLVEIFLNVERLSAGHLELKHESIPVSQMVELCVDRTRPLGDRKHIGITLQPIPGNLHITGDRELMEYACYNLLTNAVKYSPQRTEVTVSAWKDGADIRIAVRDQGIGMDQKEVKQVFQKFYRTKKAEESGEAGTGIGLSIVQQIVEQHGGEIEVTSQPGAGSCFTLVIPAARPLSPAQPGVPIVAERH
jgi:signal transduction histidine kinase